MAGLYRKKVYINATNYIYGLGGRDFTTDDARGVFAEMENAVAAGREIEQYQYIGLRK